MCLNNLRALIIFVKLGHAALISCCEKNYVPIIPENIYINGKYDKVALPILIKKLIFETQ